MQSGRLRRARERRRRLLISDRPLTVNDYLRLTDEDDLYELVDGVLVERSMAAMWQHEQLSAWLMSVLRPYVQAKQLGFVSGSRTAVQISPFRTRLPDMLFIRAERSHIITESLIVGAPDWVLEIRSRTNHPAEWHALELDYRTIGVAELWLVDPQAQVIRVARKADADYAVFDLREGRLESTAIEGFWVQASWLFFDAERPSPIDALRLLQVI
ncbi:MAG: Uma2 family endonuclease [Fimbriimonadales bacterium]|nr:Uma2 family endonuclease [Fimbriimonadales bacterium]